MKKNQKPPSVIDILHEINSKKIFIFYSFILGIIISSIIGVYKSSGPLKLEIKLTEQYYPIQEDIKNSLRYDMLNVFDDVSEFKEVVKDKELINNIDNNKIALKITSDTSRIGTQNVNAFTLIISAKLENEKVYSQYTKKIIKAISNIEKYSKNKIVERSNEQIKISEILIQESRDIFLKEKKDLELTISNANTSAQSMLEKQYVFFKNTELLKRQEINQLSKLVMILESNNFQFLKVYPNNPSFEKNIVSTKESAFIVFGFVFAGIFLVALNRFV